MYERTGYDWRSVGQLLNNDPIPGSPDELERIAGPRFPVAQLPAGRSASSSVQGAASLAP